MNSPLFMSGAVTITFNNMVTNCQCKWFEDYIEIGDDEFKTYISLADERVAVYSTFSGFKVYSEIGMVEFIVDKEDLLQWHDVCALYEKSVELFDNEIMSEFGGIVSGFQSQQTLLF